MAEKSLISGRPTLTIDEALVICKWKVADLFYKAEIGELTIYAIADGWKVGRITENDHSRNFDYKEGVRYRNLAGEVQLLVCPDDTHDMIFAGNYIIYGRNGHFRQLYQLDLKDRQPITARTFEKYRISPEKATIEIDCNQLYKSTDKVNERYIYPEPAVLIHDLFLNEKLVVMKADIDLLLSDESASQDVAIDNKPLSTRERNTFLHIIRALSELAKLPEEPYLAAAQVLIKLTDENGIPLVSQRTIADKVSESRTIL